MKKSEKYFKGCIIGGAIGDALGYPIESKSFKIIKTTYGSNGINNLDLNDKGISEITDNTQMTLFTAEGILRANCKKDKCYILAVIYNAYLRWYFTQRNIDTRGYDECTYNSYLLKYDELYEDRCHKNTSLTSLSKEEMGSIRNPINVNSVCGEVMRVAPIGLMFDKKEAFRLGCDCIALTHGKSSEYISGGMLSCIISCIIEGMEIDKAIDNAICFARDMNEHCECIEIVEKAVKLSKEDLVDIDAIRMLGEGLSSEEALAIAIYSSLKYKDDFKKALICSVNHDGNSDSTGAICGNILGAYLGIDNIDKEWIDVIELKELLESISIDLLIGYEESEEWFKKYHKNQVEI